jgi:cytoskeletal protein CcmA (bactofilin family)
MFAKSNKRLSAATPSDAGNGVPSIIGADMVIHGNFKSGGELHVEGTVHGDISVKVLTIGKDAVIRGEIVADKVKVCGAVTGCIRAQDVLLMAGAKVIGDVHHDVLSIEAGAALEGLCKRRETAKVEASRDAAALAAKPSEPVRLTPKPFGEHAPLLADAPRTAAKA